MTVDPNMTAKFDEVILRLKAGEAPEQLFVSLRPLVETEGLKRCATVSTFEQEIYERVLASTEPRITLTFDDLIDLPEVERVPRTLDQYRLTSRARSTYWNAWWFDQPEAQEPALPPRLETLIRRLVDFYHDNDEPVYELAQLVLIDADAGRRLFESQFTQADGEFDLPLCQDLLNALNDPDRAELLDPALLELHDERAAYLQARSHFLVDFLKAGTFYETEGTLDTYRTLLRGTGSRVLELHGAGGSGKTIELRWLLSKILIPERTPLERGRIPGTRVDFDFLEPVNVTRTPWLVLLEIASQLNHQLPGYPFKEFLEAYGWAAPLLLREVTNPTRVSAASRRLRNQRARLSRSVPNRFLATLNSVIDENTPVVMTFDTLEEVHLRPDGDLDGLLRLLKHVHDGAACVRLVLAGRYPVSARTLLSELPPFVSRELRTFTAEESRGYLTHRDITNLMMREVIITKAEGAPFKLSLLADLVQQQPALTSDQVKRYEDDVIYLVLRVINRVSSPDICWLLRYGVVPRSLDFEFVRLMEPQLRKGMCGNVELDDPSKDFLPNELRNNGSAFPTRANVDPTRPLDIESIWQELQAYAGTSSWVNMAPDNPNALRIHPDVVGPMRRLIRLHPVHKVLQLAAAEYYEQQAEANPQRREVWLREAIYHRFQLEGHAAGAHWRELLDDVGLDEPEVREALAAEVLGPDYVDDRGRPRTWYDDIPIITEETMSEAMVVRANALAQIARLSQAGSPHDLRWNKVDQTIAAMERLQQLNGLTIRPPWRVAYARAALALKAHRSDEANEILTEALEHLRTTEEPLDTEATYDKVRLHVLLGDVHLSLRNRTAFDSYRAALRELPTQAKGQRRLEPIIRTRLIRAHQAFNMYAEASAQLQSARDSTDLDNDHATALSLLEIRNARSTGRLEHARAEVERLDVGSAPQAYRRESVLVFLAQHNPVEALHVLDPPGPQRIAPLKPTTPGAQEHELTGLALAFLADYSGAMDAFEAARTLWHAEGDLDSEVRCHTHAALLQIREVGNLSLAEQHLAEGADLRPEAMQQEWLRLSLARAELLVRQDRAADGMHVVWAALTMLKHHNGHPSALVRAAIEGLATGQREHVPELLDILVSNTNLITPPSARVVALAYLDRVPTIQDPSARKQLRKIRNLLRGRREHLSAADLAVQELTVAEVYRLWGRTKKASWILKSTAQHGAHLTSLHFVRRWARAHDRIDVPVVAEMPAVQRFLVASKNFPALRGAFAVERAEAALKRPSNQMSAERWMDSALHDFDQHGGQGTQWHARLELIKGALGSGAQTEQAKAQALAIISRLNSTIHVSPLSGLFPDLEQDPPSMHIVLAGAVVDDVMRKRFGAREPEWQAIAGVLARLVEEMPIEDGIQDASEELANRLDQNWRMIARALGQLILPDTSPLHIHDEPTEFRIEVRHRKWSMMPWELAYRPGTEMLLSLDSRAGPLYRALSATAMRRSEVSFVQLALNRLMNAALPMDGEFGPITRQALTHYQRDHGLQPSGRLTDELRTRLQHALVTGHKPLVVVVRQSPGRQLMSHRGHANTGMDLSRLYRWHGFEVEVVENPTLKGLSNALRTLISSGRVPDLLHLSGGLRESNGNVAFSFLAGSGEEESYSEIVEEFPVSSMDGLLSPFPDNEVAPVVVLDVNRPRGSAETALHLLQRNAFAGELFSLGRCSAVLGTGLVGREGNQLYEHLVRSLADGRSLSETITTVRGLASTSEPREDVKLERVLSFVGVALFTNLPWLRLTRRKDPEA